MIKENIGRETSQENAELARAKQQLLKSFDYLFDFNGAGHMEIDMKILKRGQKEVMIRCGRSYRFVLDTDAPQGIQE